MSTLTVLASVIYLAGAIMLNVKVYSSIRGGLIPIGFYAWLGLAYGAAAVGMLLRTNWGRVTGIIVCILAMTNVPLGTIIGALGLVAFIRGGKCFGPDKITHKTIKTAYKERKRVRKANRQKFGKH